MSIPENLTHWRAPRPRPAFSWLAKVAILALFVFACVAFT